MERLTGNQLGYGKKVDCRYDLTDFQPSDSEDQVGLRSPRLNGALNRKSTWLRENKLISDTTGVNLPSSFSFCVPNACN